MESEDYYNGITMNHIISALEAYIETLAPFQSPLTIICGAIGPPCPPRSNGVLICLWERRMWDLSFCSAYSTG